MSVNDLGEFEVSVMHAKCGQWKWPDSADCIFYEKASIVKAIQPPIPANNHGYYVFNMN